MNCGFGRLSRAGRSGWSSAWPVVAGRIDGELAEKFAGGRVQDGSLSRSRDPQQRLANPAQRGQELVGSAQKLEVAADRLDGLDPCRNRACAGAEGHAVSLLPSLDAVPNLGGDAQDV